MGILSEIFKAIDHPLYVLLHDEPNPEMTSFVFRETLMTHLLLWGNAYAQIIRNGKGEVVALYPLMSNKDTAVILQPSDVLHIPGLGFDGLVGYSPIAMAKNAIGMAIVCEEYGAKFSRTEVVNSLMERIVVPIHLKILDFCSVCTGNPV